MLTTLAIANAMALAVSPKTEYLKAYLYAVMSEALEVNTVLTEIYLYSNNIGDDGAAALAQAISHNSTLKTIRLYSKSEMSGPRRWRRPSGTAS